VDNRIQIGEKAINLIYENFPRYFENGEIIIGGSFYYRLTDCGVKTEFKDVDIIIDDKISCDKILKEILNFFNSNEYNIITQFSRRIEGDFIGCLHIEGFAPIDFLRDDFSDNQEPIEIISGVYSHYSSNRKMVEVYDRFLRDPLLKPHMRKKYSDLRSYFQNKFNHG
jgi:hypothetical protein